jgi:iron complex outermembrane receptor protein
VIGGHVPLHSGGSIVRKLFSIIAATSFSGSFSSSVPGGVLYLAGAIAFAQSALAQSPPGDSADERLEEIIVTAEFRNKDLQDTPLAITAVNAAMLEQRSQTEIMQVAAQAPNVSLMQAGANSGSSMIAFIRGVGQTDYNFSQEPGVGVYVDDVYYATLTGSVLDLLDLDRVEILRGPQGTLAGRNSIGGAVKLFSARPEGADTGYVEASFGTLDRTDVRAMGDFSLVPDKLFVRLSGVAKQRDGYVTRLDYRCTHPSSAVRTFVTGFGCTLGEDGSQSFAAGRAALRWLPSESVEVSFVADATNDKSSVQANTLLFAGPARPAPLSLDGVPFDSRFVPYGANAGDPNQPNDPYLSYATFTHPEVPPGTANWRPLTVPPINHFDSEGFSGIVDWRVSDRVSIKSITAYREYENRFTDHNGGAPVTTQLTSHTLQHDQTSQEIRASIALDAVDLTFGAFYLDQDGFEQVRVDLPYADPRFDFVHGPDPTPSQSTAVFANVEWRATDALSIAAGARVSDEEKDYVFRRSNPDGTQPTCFIPGCGPNWEIFGFDGRAVSFADSRTDYRLSVSYHFSDAVMLYGQGSTGYKSGGFNARPFFPSQIQPFDPETLTSYEIGLKNTLRDGAMRLNAALFTNDYEDIIVFLTRCDSFSPFPGAPCLMPVNGGNADVTGAEVELESRPTDRLSIDVSVGYLDFEYTELAPSASVTLDAVTAFTPKTKWSAGVQYDFPLGGGGSLAARLDVAGQDDVFTDPVNSPAAVDPLEQRVPLNPVTSVPTVPFNRISGYTLANARLTYRPPGDDWRLALEVTNLTDEVYTLTHYYNQAAATVSGQPGKPQLWALTFRKDFD